jgi:predicted HTH domain antitoxin
MHTLTDDELKREPAQLLDDAQRGQITVVTTDGRPVMMAVPLENGAPLRSALVDLAAALYDRDEISLGTAARIAGLSYSEMIDELGRRGMATVRYTPEELERELAHAATLAGRR